MNNRQRQKVKVLRRWIRSAKHSDGPLIPSSFVAEMWKVLDESIWKISEVIEKMGIPNMYYSEGENENRADKRSMWKPF